MFPVLIIVLLLVFRSIAAAALPLAMAGGALGISSAVGYLIARVVDVSTLYSNIISMIGMAVAIDYSLFIIKRYREEVVGGLDRHTALTVAYRTAGRSVVLSGGAVAIALCSLFIPRLMAFTSIALGGAVVTVAALLLTTTALPALLALMGPRIEWGHIPLRSRLGREPRAHRTARGPGAVAGIAGAVALLAVASPIVGISLQAPVASATILPKGDAARTGLDVVSSELDAHDLFPLQIVLTSDTANARRDVLDSTRRLTAQAIARSDVASVTSAATLGLPAAELDAVARGDDPRLSSVWSAVGNKVASRIIVDPKTSPDSAATHALVKALRSSSGGVHGDIRVQVTGATAQGADFDNTLKASIPWIVAAVLALTLVMMASAFRSIVLPLLALAFNGIVVVASLGILTMVVKAAGDGEMNSVTPVLLFAVLFGLSMDYMVIIVSRIIERYRRDGDFDLAVVQGSRQTRSMVNSAALIMVAVFASFMSAQISIVREIGIGLGVAVVLDAVVIRMVVLPGILRLLGPKALGLSRRS